MDTLITSCKSKQILISSCQNVHQNNAPAYLFLFLINGNLSFCFISKWGRATQLWCEHLLTVTLACLLLVETICCMDQRWEITICILVVRRSDFRSLGSLILDDFSVACVQVSAQHVCVCVRAAPTVIYACCHLACTMSKGQKCHLVPHGYLLKVIGYVASETRSERIWAGGRSLSHGARTTLSSVLSQKAN